MSGRTVRGWLLEHTELEPSLLDGPGFTALIAERSRATSSGDERGYVELLDRSPDEVERFVAEIAVPESWFFRYPRSFEVLVDDLRRRLAGGQAVLRMCSVGCAAGQEPYSMAMSALHAGWPAERIEILAFDRNGEAIRSAMQGRYGPASIRGEMPAWSAPFLDRDAGGVLVDASVRSMVRFERADVLGPEPVIPPQQDAVFCRNMLIYLNAEAREKLGRLLCRSLVAGGLMFVGHAEQSVRAIEELSPIPTAQAFALERAAREGPVRSTGAPAAAARRAAIPERRPAAAAPACRAIGTAPGPVDGTSLERARQFADAGRIAESEAMLREHIAARGPSAGALELLGLVRMAADDIDGARRLFEQAVYLDPARTASLLQLALITERAGDPRRAAMLWDRARRSAEPSERSP